MQYVCGVTGRRRALVPIPFEVARVPAMLTEIADTLLLGLFPKSMLITRDQVTLLKRDNVVSQEAVADGLDLRGLGIEPRAMESVVPGYLYRFRKTGQFDRGRIAP